MDWTGAGLNQGFAGDSEFSRILVLAERMVEAENCCEDFWTAECGPLLPFASLEDFSSAHVIVGAKAGPQLFVVLFGRTRTMLGGIAKSAGNYVGPTGAAVQEDFERFIRTQCSIQTADIFFQAGDEEVRGFYRPLMGKRYLHGLADTEFPVHDWSSLRSTMSPGAEMRFDDYLQWIESEEHCTGEAPLDVYFDNEHWRESKLGKVTSWWPSMLTHGVVVSNKRRRSAVPREFLGPQGADPYPKDGERKSFLVNLVLGMNPKDAIGRIGNGLNAKVLLWWTLYLMSNFVRFESQNVLPPKPSTHGNADSDSDGDLELDLAACNMDEDFASELPHASVTPCKKAASLPPAVTPPLR